MKKIISITASILLIAVVFAQSAKAQSAKEELDFYQSIFGMEKKAVVADFLDIETDNPFGLYTMLMKPKEKNWGKNVSQCW